MSKLVVPELGESIVEATVGRWLKAVGDQVGEGEAVAELETDKVNMEVIAEEAGVLETIVKGEGQTVTVGEVIGTVGSGSGTATVVSATAPAASQESRTPVQALAPTPAAVTTEKAHSDDAAGLGHVTNSLLGRTTPSIRKMAREYGVDVNRVKESGGVAAAKESEQAPKSASSSQSTVTHTGQATQSKQGTGISSVVGERAEERVKMSRRRLTIARRLVEVQHTAAMLTTFNEVDMTAILALRARRKDRFKEQFGVGLGFMSFFTKAVVGALKAFPRLNAEISGEDMILKHYYDIGVAVSAEGGLVVPVVRNADRLSFAEIEREIAGLAAKARSQTLGLSDLQGGTFTITNGGVFGSLFSTPILNAPQVGILGMHGILQRPVAINGQVEIRPMMYLALSYDHRIVDGSEAVQFLVKVKQLAEDPESLLLEG